MPSHTTTYRTTVSLPLKARPDIVPACPGVDRCQLEVIENDHSDALTIEDGPAYYRKLVKVGLVQNGGGCDVKVRVGVVESGGPIAVGGELISGGDPPVWDTWERKLVGCIDPESIFLMAPQHLLNIRYYQGGETVNLIVAKSLGGGGFYRVCVGRRGGATPSADLQLQYSGGALGHVSAALSANLQTLYVVETKINEAQTDATATAHVYTYNRFTGVWSLFVSAELAKPWTSGSPRFYTVNRQGHAAGYWAPQATSYTETFSDDGPCIDPDNNPGEYSHYFRNRFDTIYGGHWNLNSGGFPYVSGSSRTSENALYAGDFYPVVESTVSVDIATSGWRDTWNWTTVHAYAKESYRTQEVEADENLSFSATVGASALTGTNDLGRRHRAFATYHEYNELYWPDPSLPVWSTGFKNFTFSHFDEYGTKKIDVTAGGWVVDVTDMVLTEYDTSPINIAWDEPSVSGGSTGAGVQVCPDALDDMWVRGATITNIDTKSIIHPLDLGDYFAIHRSFTSYDQASGDTYMGIEVQATESSTMGWRIFKNGGEVTSAVASCTGRPLAEFCAIYWRH